MKVVSVINYKGGVGKTTVTSNLAAYVASKGKRVLMIDVDPQTNLTFSFIDNIEWEKKYASIRTLKNFFQPILETGEKKISLEDLIIPLDLAGIKLDIISSHLDLINIDMQLAANLAAPKIQGLATEYTEYIELAAGLAASRRQRLATKYLEVHNYFREEIDKLNEKYDLILIDCAPSFNVVTQNTLVASDNYLTPSKMDYLSTLGVQQLTRNVKEFLHEYNQYMQVIKAATANPALLGIVATMVSVRDGDIIAANKQYWNKLESQYEMFNTFIRDNKTHYSMAPSNNIPVLLSKNTPSNVVEELQKLGDEFMKKAGI